jgi:hypothetical protein
MSCSRSASYSAAGDTKEAGTPVLSHPRGAADSPLPPTNANSFPRSLPQSADRSAKSGVHPDNSDPSQLSFYAPAIHDIIDHAKQISHCDLTSLNSFPLRPHFNTKAGEYMNEAIVERRSRGLIIPDGMYVYHCPTETDHYQGGGLNIQTTSPSLFV